MSAVAAAWLAALFIVMAASDEQLSKADLKQVTETINAYEHARFVEFTVPPSALDSVLKQRKTVLAPQKDELLADLQSTGVYPRVVELPDGVLSEVHMSYQDALQATCTPAYLARQDEAEEVTTNLLDLINNPVLEDGVPAGFGHAVVDVGAIRALPDGRYVVECTIWLGEVDVFKDGSERRIDMWDEVSYTVQRGDDDGWLIAARSRLASAQDASADQYGPEAPATAGYADRDAVLAELDETW